MNKNELYLRVISHSRGEAAIERRRRRNLDVQMRTLTEQQIRYFHPQPIFNSFWWYIVWQLTGFANPNSIVKWA